MSSGGLLGSSKVCIDRFKIQFEKGPSAEQSGSHTYMVQEFSNSLKPKAVRTLRVNDTIMEPYSRQTTRVTLIEPLTRTAKDLWVTGGNDSYVFSSLGKIVAVDRRVKLALLGPSGQVEVSRIRRYTTDGLRVDFRDGNQFVAAGSQRVLLETVGFGSRFTRTAELEDLKPGQMVQGRERILIVQDHPTQSGLLGVEVYCFELQSLEAKADAEASTNAFFADGLIVMGCSLP